MIGLFITIPTCRDPQAVLTVYHDIAEKISGPQRCSCYAKFVAHWSFCIPCAKEPPAAETKDRLMRYGGIAIAMRELLSDHVIREAMEKSGCIGAKELDELYRLLLMVAKGAKGALASFPLSDENGRTRRGRRRAAPAASIAPKVYCAMMVAEIWKINRGAYPALRNPEAATAAQMLWESIGHKSSSWGEKPCWFPHFKVALKLDHPDRSDFLRRVAGCTASHRLLCEPQTH